MTFVPQRKPLDKKTKSISRQLTLPIAVLACATAAAQGSIPWSYPNMTNNWASVSSYPSGNNCAATTGQSPIDLGTVNPVNAVAGSVTLPKLVVPAQMSSDTSTDLNYILTVPAGSSGTPPQIAVTRGAATVQWNVVSYHFHTPSEHKLPSYPINARSMELHVKTVNATDAHAYAVFAVVLVEAGPNSPQPNYLGPVFNLLSGNSNPGSVTLYDPDPSRSGLNGFLKGFLDYPFWTYQGSLTTPPCTGSVTWYVSTVPVWINSNDAQTFSRYLLKIAGYSSPATNARTIQPVSAVNAVEQLSQ